MQQICVENAKWEKVVSFGTKWFEKLIMGKSGKKRFHHGKKWFEKINHGKKSEKVVSSWEKWFEKINHVAFLGWVGGLMP